MEKRDEKALGSAASSEVVLDIVLFTKQEAKGGGDALPE